MKTKILLSLTVVFYSGCGTMGSSSSSSSSSSIDIVSTLSSNGSGHGGSLARFAISGDYLYTINREEMTIFDVSDASKPQKASKVHLPWDVETIFGYKDYLYIGSNSGMYIYDNTIPVQPTQITNFRHVQSCDPVVVSDDIAFVTLNTRSNCWVADDGANRLEIISVASPQNPKLIKTIDMWSPTGLGVDGTHLFICDGDSGLKVFDINKTDENGSIAVNVNVLDSYGDINCYDVIAFDDTLIVSNHNNIRQFDYSSFPMEELGEIK